MTWLIYTALAVFGAAIGSFLNVVIHRVPNGASVVSPPSACPQCGSQIRPWHNIPVVSWLVLGGKCRDCRAPISARYPLVEVANALLWVGAFHHFGWSVEFVLFAYLASVGLALTMIDIAVHRLPNVIVFPSYAVVTVILTIGALVGEDWGGTWSQLGRAALAGVVLYVFYFLLLIIYPKGMGFGDVKLAGVLGAALGWLSWGTVLVGGFAAFLLGGVLSILLLATGKAKRGTGIPFGPWMILGAAIGAVWGPELFNQYLRLVGF